MSVASEITRLQTAKAGIKSALEAKGVTVSSAATLDDYPQYVEDIPAGGDEELVKGLIQGSLTALTVPNGVTSVKANMFNGDTSIKVVNLNTGVTSLGSNCFNGASNLTAITVASGVRSFGNTCFQSCNNLQTIDGLGALNNIGQNFMKDCNKLETPIVISVSTVAEYAFQNCYKIPSYTFTGSSAKFGINQWSTSDSYAIFKNNTGCTYWDFTNCYIIPVTNQKNHFNGCTGELRIPAVMANYFLQSKTPLDENNYFYQCALSGNVVTAENKYDIVEIHYKTNNDTIMSPASSDRDFYTTIQFGLVDNTYDATTGGTMVFYGPSAKAPCFALTCFNKTNLTDIDISNCTGLTLSRNMDGQFTKCFNLSSITISSAVTEFPNHTFSQCYSITSIDLTNIRNVGKQCFYGCSGLTSLDFSNITGDTVPELLCANCSGLTSVTLSETIRTVMGEAFKNCSSLQSITFLGRIGTAGYNAFQNIPTGGTIYCQSEDVDYYTTYKNNINMSTWTVQAISE